MKKLWIALLALVLAAGLGAGIGLLVRDRAARPVGPVAPESVAPVPEPPAPVPEPSAPPPTPEPVTVRLVAAGDNLIHDNIYRQAAARAGGQGYDFSPAYAAIAPLVEGADIAFYNQETPLAEAVAPLSNYPRFNSPRAVGDALVALGFNVVGLANNHMFDVGEKGVLASLDYWESQPTVATAGIWREEAAMDKPVLVEKQGVTFAFVALTHRTNGLTLPGDTALRYLTADETAQIERQLALARAAADVVVVSAHWGEEGAHQPTTAQRTLAQQLADGGADVVLGHHSHTLQPIEWLTGKSGNDTLVVYSLGNLISSMAAPENMLGGLLELELTKDFAAGKTTVTAAALHPLVTHYDGAARRDVRVIPLADYTDELAARHGLRPEHPDFSPRYLRDLTDRALSDWQPLA